MYSNNHGKLFNQPNGESMRKPSALKGAAAVTAGYLIWRFIQRRSSLNLTDKVVLITGGSRGLGLQLAREFGARGAAVAICGRNRSSLDRAEEDLISLGVKVHARVCDVSKRDQVESLISDVVQQMGPIDILVNNAGIIRVGPASLMALSDFEEAMSTMFWAHLYTILAVVPSMRQRQQGSIVNIISIGGKLSVPHLLPYSCAKFAALGLSQGLHSELAGEGINVTTIVPGLMRTGSHLNAQFKGKYASEYCWFSAGAATSLVSVEAKRAAQVIVRATVRREVERTLSIPAELMARLHDVFPQVTGRILEVVNRTLPSRPSDERDGALAGTVVEDNLNSALWKAFTRPGQKAAAYLNQL
jgi:NAD(P)-dependent dehydrogenase (short-subunit alcohol dehydrogenase family)